MYLLYCQILVLLLIYYTVVVIAFKRRTAHGILLVEASVPKCLLGELKNDCDMK